MTFLCGQVSLCSHIIKTFARLQFVKIILVSHVVFCLKWWTVLWNVCTDWSKLLTEFISLSTDSFMYLFRFLRHMTEYFLWFLVRCDDLTSLVLLLSEVLYFPLNFIFRYQAFYLFQITVILCSFYLFIFIHHLMKFLNSYCQCILHII